MRMNLGPGQSATIRYTVRCPLRGHYTIGPTSIRYRNAFNLFVSEKPVLATGLISQFSLKLEM